MVLKVNGVVKQISSPPDSKLLNVLRDELQLTGTKYGCGEGACGACTVHIEGKPVRSCLTPVYTAAGKSVTTIEGLEKGGRLHAVQQAFLDTDPLQCSYCASGMIMSAVALLENKPHPNNEEIITAMNGNICRCGTYVNIIKAIRQAVKIQQEQ